MHDCVTRREAEQTTIDLLLGVDVLVNLETGCRKRLSSHLSAVEFSIGWALAGVEPVMDAKTDQPEEVAIVSHVGTPDTEFDLSRLWAGEELSAEEELASSSIIGEVEKTIEFRDHRYWVGLPWLRGGTFDNFSSAAYRLRRLVGRLRADGKFATYQAELSQLLHDGHAERVRFDRCDKAYYMPHRAVIRKNALTTKVRVVFDATHWTMKSSPAMSSSSRSLS